jgi:creatinine amidohydrolase
VRLADLCWPQLSGQALLAVPIGSTEQHGPHLPVDTDTRIAVALAEGLAAGRPDVLVAPALPYSASGEHAGFPGTLSLGTQALTTVLVELVRSADDTCRGVILVNAHGGNAGALTSAVSLLRTEGRRVLAWGPRAPWPDDLHAGRAETAVLLHLAPQAVRSEATAAGPVPSVAQLVTSGVRAASPTGVLGDPAGADAELGRQVLEAWLEDLQAAVERAVAGWDRP